MKLLHLMALALHESGAPMSYDEIRERLHAIGVDRPVSALQKAWHGRSLLRKSRDGKFHLGVDDAYGDWRYVQSVTHRELERASPAPPTTKAALALVPPPAKVDHTPLTLDEARDALRDGPFTQRRLIIALVDATGHPMSVAEVVAELAAFEHSRASALDVERSVRGLPGPLHRDADGRLAVDADHPDLPGIRALVGKHAREIGARRRENEERAQHIATWQAKEERERAERRTWYAGASKLVVRAIFAGHRFLGAATLDPEKRAFEDHRDAGKLARRLGHTEIVLALDPWGAFEHLGVDARGHTLVDLSPPNKTRTIDRLGRTLKITPDLLIAGTLGTPRPLGDEKTLRAQLDRGESKARRRLHADLKALWRFYEYGCLHHAVRLRWGFLDEMVPVGWNVGRLPMTYEILKQAGETGRLVEVVFGAAPGWSDPWSRGRLCRVLALGLHVARLRGEGGEFEVPTDEIAALRIVDGIDTPVWPA